MHPDQDINIRLTKYKNECGCKLGAKFMTGAFALSLIFNITQYGIISFDFLTHLPLIVLSTFIGAGLGKLSGILYAKYKYKQLSAQLTQKQAG